MTKETLKSYFRPIYHSYLSVRYGGRAERIVRDYAAHYQKARELFVSDGNVVELAIPSLDEVKVRPLYPVSGSNPLVTFPANYTALVERVHRDVQARLEHTVNCRFFPKIPINRSAFPTLTKDIPEVRAGKIIALQLKSWQDLDALEEICAILIPPLQRKVFGSYVIVDKVYAYRNIVSRLEDQVSWRWHSDNHPTQVKKIIIYLTDVGENTGPLEYVRSKDTGEAPVIEPKPLLGVNITQRQLAGYLATGHELVKLTGKRGTTVFFDENIVHKANVAGQGHRDALFLQVRPCTFKPERYIDPRWTGSFEHVDFNPDPYDYQPRPKIGILSSAY